MKEAMFIRLLACEDKAAALREAVEAVQQGRLPVGRHGALSPVVHIVAPESFRQVPGSPFAYWVSERIRRLFTELPPFEGEGRTVKQGLATADDFCFVRAWWEVAPEKIVTGIADMTPDQFRQQTFEGKRWAPFAKGGEYSPYYADLHLVVNWERDGEEIKSRINPETNRPYSNVWQLKGTERDYFFRPGLTWPLRAMRYAPSALPFGSIFSVRGYSIFAPTKDLKTIGGLGNSTAFDFLFKVMLGRFGFPEFIVGVLQKLPIPDISGANGVRLRRSALSCIDLKRNVSKINETNHNFLLPTLLQTKDGTLALRIVVWRNRLAEAQQQLTDYQREIDDIAFQLYGIDGDDRRAIEESLHGQPSTINEEETEDIEDAEPETAVDARSLVADLISYAVGCAFGRWDVRYATGEKQPPELPDPFAPLPVCSPGMLTGDDGLPLCETPPDYPLSIDWDGVLVDDPSHSDDIVRRVREVLEIIFNRKDAKSAKENNPQESSCSSRLSGEKVEQEACEMLGVKALRDYFRKPGAGGFWMDHVRRYSKSRRKAPIYWLLQSSKKNYALWVYYHRLDKDILFKALVNYVEPKIRLEESNLTQLRSQRAEVGLAGKAAKQLEKQIDKQEALLSELLDFRDKLRRAADLHLSPDLNDGVVLNIAPLWELVPWSEAGKYWEELLEGKYEWSSIGKQLRQRGALK